MLIKFLIILIMFICFGCSTSEKDTSAKQKSDILENNVAMQQAAELLISGFMANLKSELMYAVKEGGYAHATDVCQLKAPLVMEKFSKDNWSIKRVTDKPRNPLNQTDSHEQEILELFADSLNKLTFFHEWTDAEQQTDYCYYQPIYIGMLCLKCHGEKSKIEPEIAQALDEKYPQDKATGYSDGDLRGLFVVHLKTTDNVSLLEQ